MISLVLTTWVSREHMRVRGGLGGVCEGRVWGLWWGSAEEEVGWGGGDRWVPSGTFELELQGERNWRTDGRTEG